MTDLARSAQLVVVDRLRLDAVLRERFNLGFASGQSQATACNGASRRAEATAASRGQALAQTLSRVMRRNAPPPQTPQEPPVEP